MRPRPSHSPFSYADTETFTSWGLNELARFHQGKGPLVMIVPLLAGGLTVRWMTRRQWPDLVGIALLNICAIGLSANGLFIGPTSGGFVALAFLLSSPKLYWRAALRFAGTLIYPAAVAFVVLVERLALPSELIGAQQRYSSLLGVVGWRAEGLAILALLPMLPIVAREERTRIVAAIYLPLALILILNPVGWAIFSDVTGNLPFRVFWALPGVFIAACVCIGVLEQLGLASKLWVPRICSGIALVGGILFNATIVGLDQNIQWHLPDLKVPRDDYDVAMRLAADTPPGCKALVPSRYATWMTGLRRGPYLVVVSGLYLTHYRFSESHDELRDRWALFNLVNGGSVEALPNATQLGHDEMQIGLIASERNNPNVQLVNQFATTLGLSADNSDNSPLLLWRGGCTPSANGSGTK